MSAPLRRAVLFAVVAALVAAPALALTEWAAGETRSRLRAEPTATAERAAGSDADEVA